MSSIFHSRMKFAVWWLDERIIRESEHRTKTRTFAVYIEWNTANIVTWKSKSLKCKTLFCLEFINPTLKAVIQISHLDNGVHCRITAAGLRLTPIKVGLSSEQLQHRLHTREHYSTTTGYFMLVVLSHRVVKPLQKKKKLLPYDMRDGI